LSNHECRTHLEDRNWKLEIRNSELDTRCIAHEFPISSFRFPGSNFKLRFSIFHFRISIFALLLLPAALLCAQVETVESPNATAVWVSQSHVEGHLALRFSSDGAFSPDASLLAVVADDKVTIMDLRAGAVQRVLKPHVPDVRDLEIHSANFTSPHQIFLLANGAFHVKGNAPATTPLLAFQWDIEGDRLDGKVNAVGRKGGFSPGRYFPMIGYLVLYKESTFAMWNPRTEQAGSLTLPDLKQIPNLFEFSPDGHWLVLAQIQTT
jgi:hypothetical protein